MEKDSRAEEEEAGELKSNASKQRNFLKKGDHKRRKRDKRERGERGRSSPNKASKA